MNDLKKRLESLEVQSDSDRKELSAILENIIDSINFQSDIIDDLFHKIVDLFEEIENLKGFVIPG